MKLRTPGSLNSDPYRDANGAPGTQVVLAHHYPLVPSWCITCTGLASHACVHHQGLSYTCGVVVGYTTGGSIGCGCDCHGGSVASLQCIVASLQRIVLSLVLPITGLLVVLWLQALHGPIA